MEQKPTKPMTPFDTATTPRHLYMLKLMLPYTPPSVQHMLAVYIKFLELQYTMRHFHNLSCQEPGARLFSDLKPYMDKEEQEKMEQMEDMMNMMEMVQSMQPMSDSMFEAASDNGSGFNPMDLMMGMMNPENQEMFDMYSSIFKNTGDSQQSGDTSDEQAHPPDRSSEKQKGDVTYE